jgi:FecR protein
MNRKQSLLKSLLVCGVALAAVATMAADNVVQVTARVVRIRGDARYKVGAGAWQTLKQGDELGAGTIIETGVNSRIDLMMGEGAPPTARPVVGEVLTYAPAAEQNMVRIWENSRMAIDKLTRTETGADVVTETQLDLQAGHIFGSVKKMSAASKYEVKIPNGVAGIRGTIYDISVEGVIKCLVGSIYLAYVDSSGKAASQVVMADQEFDIRTGVLQQLPNTDRTGLLRAITQLRMELASTVPLVYTVDRTLVQVSPN